MAENELEVPTDSQINSDLFNAAPEAGVADEATDTPKQDVSTPAATPTSQTPQAVEIQQMLQQMLRNELQPVQSEIGQFRKMRAEWQKSQAKQPTTPASWEQLDPEARKASQEVVSQILKELGISDTIEQYKSDRQEQEQYRQLRTVTSIAEQVAGNEFKELDPLLGKLYDQHFALAQQGNRDSQELLEGIHSGSKFAIKELVAMAKEEKAKTFDAQADAAKNAKVDRAKRIGTAVGTKPPEIASTDWKQNMPKDPAKRLEYLKELMDQREGSIFDRG